MRSTGRRNGGEYRRRDVGMHLEVPIVSVVAVTAEEPVVTAVVARGVYVERDTDGPGGTCPQCNHPYDPHISLATVFFNNGTRAAPAGGHVFCPEPRCKCHRSWALVMDVGFDIRERILPMTRAAAQKLGVPLL